ncbi:MAG: hypothetical protein ABII23_07745 [bacterium]
MFQFSINTGYTYFQRSWNFKNRPLIGLETGFNINRYFNLYSSISGSYNLEENNDYDTFMVYFTPKLHFHVYSKNKINYILGIGYGFLFIQSELNNPISNEEKPRRINIFGSDKVYIAGLEHFFNDFGLALFANFYGDEIIIPEFKFIYKL